MLFRSPGKGVNQMQTDRAAVDSELALLAVGGYERKSWQVNPYFNKREDFVGSGLPSFLVCRLDGLTPEHPLAPACGVDGGEAQTARHRAGADDRDAAQQLGEAGVLKKYKTESCKTFQ